MGSKTLITKIRSYCGTVTLAAKRDLINAFIISEIK